ncbi:MAG: PhoU family transcriptional regulator [Lysinibacillus sp.]
MKNLFYLTLVVLMLSVLSACSGDNTIEDEPLIYEKRQYISKEFIEENAKVGLTTDEVQDIFGHVPVSGVVDHTETWLYDSSSYKQLTYHPNLAAIASDEIKQGELDYQLYINFVEDKAVMYSYFYKGDDGNVWEYQVTDKGKPFENIVGEK